MSSRLFVRFGVGLLTVALAACGSGSNPASPSGGKATLRGVATVNGATAASHGDVSALSTSSGAITVRVQEQISISTTISVNGTFELDDVPSGTFHLEFVSNGQVIGTVTVTNVTATSQINLQVEVKITVVVVIKLEVDGVEEHNNPGNRDSDD